MIKKLFFDLLKLSKCRRNGLLRSKQRGRVSINIEKRCKSLMQDPRSLFRFLLLTKNMKDVVAKKYFVR